MQATLDSRYPESGNALLLDYVEGAPSCKFHYQPEMELVLVRGSMGRRLIGDVVSDFNGHDLVLVGPCVPHMWQTMAVDSDPSKADAIVVHFSKESLGLEFLAKPELRGVKELLDKASRGLVFDDDARLQVEGLLEKLVAGDEFSRLTCLLEVLHVLASAPCSEIASKAYDLGSVTRDQKLYGSLLEFVQLNHRDPISVTDAAKHVCMSVSGFCRFFKRVSGDTFVSFLNQWRVDRACLLLEETSMPISQICFEVGYGNLSHFNRQFRRFKKTSPRDYRQRAKHNPKEGGGRA